MKFVAIIIICALASLPVSASDQRQRVIKALFGADENVKFSLHQPAYFILGNDDLKLQFGLKYRVAKTFSLYFAYSQLMLWDIYKKSKPFEDVNYKPELFYRFLENQSEFFQSIDVGYLHTSNGQSDDISRSVDRIFVRSNIITKIKNHDVGAILMIYDLYNEDPTNKDIVKHLGYWDATFYFSELVKINSQRLDLEVKTYAGQQLYNFDQGAYQLGFIYRLGNPNFNPSIYLQRFEGYGEDLLRYNRRRTEWRLGLLLSF